MNRYALAAALTLATGLPVTAPVAAATPACPTVNDGGTENYATILRDVRVESFDDVDRVTFTWGADRLAPPAGPVSYWQAPPFSVTQVDKAPGVAGSAAYVVAFRGAAAHNVIMGTSEQPDNKYVKSFSEPDEVAVSSQFPVVQSARLLKDADNAVAWGIGTRSIRCPAVYITDTPARAVVEFPH